MKRENVLGFLILSEFVLRKMSHKDASRHTSNRPLEKHYEPSGRD